MLVYFFFEEVVGEIDRSGVRKTSHDLNENFVMNPGNNKT